MSIACLRRLSFVLNKNIFIESNEKKRLMIHTAWPWHHSENCRSDCFQIHPSPYHGNHPIRHFVSSQTTSWSKSLALLPISVLHAVHLILVQLNAALRWREQMPKQRTLLPISSYSTFFRPATWRYPTLNAAHCIESPVYGCGRNKFSNRMNPSQSKMIPFIALAPSLLS